MTKKKVYPPEFKARIVRELVEGDDSVGVVAARHHLNAGMVARWRKQLFDDAALVFAQEQFSSLYDLQVKLNDYVWWYSNERMHSILGYMSPVEFRKAGLSL